MTRRTAIVGTGLRIYIDGAELGNVVDPGPSCSGPGWDEDVKPAPDYNVGSIEIHGEGRCPRRSLKRLRRLLVEPRPKTHARSPRESLRRR